MRVFLAFVMIALAGLSHTQPLAQKDIFVVTAAEGSYGTFPVHGVGAATVDGFKFTVSARPDGALPVLKQSFHRKVFSPWFDGGNRWTELGILRRVGTAEPATYAWVARMPLHGVSVLAGNGLLLTPGEYLVRVPLPVANPSEVVGAALLGGHYLDLAGQAKHWQLVATRNDLVLTDSTESPYPYRRGWRFTVQPNAEGALPVVTQVLGVLASGEIEVWKMRPNGVFFLFASWSIGEYGGYGSFMTQPPMPGLPLDTGEYLLIGGGGRTTRGEVGHLVLLSGFWSPKD